MLPKAVYRKNLMRRVDAPLAAPDADHQEHRDQHRLPEQVEQEQVLRDEGAQHRELDQEHHRVEELHVLRDRAEGAGHDQRPEERGQQHQQDVVAVEADLVVARPRRRSTAGASRTAGPATLGVEAHVQPRRSARAAATITQSVRPAHDVALARRATRSSSSMPEQRQEQHEVEQDGVRHGASSTAARRRCRRARSSAYRCRLPVCTRPSTPAARCAERGQAVQRAVEQEAVAEAQEDVVRDPDQRPAEQRARRARR